MPTHSLRKKIPNWLTYFRIAVIPALIVVFYLQINDLLNGDWGYGFSATLFLLACITDWLDGYVARIWQAESNVGRFLDPIADKLLVATVLVLLVADKRADVLPSIAIVCREILVSGLREFLAEIRVGMPVSRLAKWKTGAQMTALALLLMAPGAFGLPTELIGRVLLWVAALLTLMTGWGYCKTGWRHMQP